MEPCLYQIVYTLLTDTIAVVILSSIDKMADDRFQDVGDLEGLSFPSPEHPAASVVEDDLIRIYYSSIQNQYTADTLLVQDEVDYDDSDAVIADDGTWITYMLFV